jgi:hypothetical protein
MYLNLSPTVATFNEAGVFCYQEVVKSQGVHRYIFPLKANDALLPFANAHARLYEYRLYGYKKFR